MNELSINHRAVIGGNLPPSETEILKLRLADYREEAETYQRLSQKEIPAEITTDEQAGDISDYIKAVNSFDKTIEKIHKKEKEPYLEAGRAADAWKNDYIKKTAVLVTRASPVLLAWNKKKEAIEKARLAEIARKAQEDAERLAAEALAHEAEGIKDTAEDLMTLAVMNEHKADLIHSGAYKVKTVSRGDFSSSGIKRPWVGAIESMATIDLEALRNYLKEDDVLAALNRAVKDGVREVRGAVIYQDEKLTNR